MAIVIHATVEASTIAALSGNRAQQGGGIYNSDGTLMVTDSTFSNNSGYSGGGIRSAGPATITNSTFSNNVSLAGSGGGLVVLGTERGNSDQLHIF